MKLAVYAGSFDPITLGHEDIIKRASKMFDKVQVVLARNASKTTLFSWGDRKDMLEKACAKFKNVSVGDFDGLLVEYCEFIGARFLIRGLRAVTDFEYELLLAHANRTQSTKVETVFLPTHPELSFVSSSTVRELARLKGDLKKFVSPDVEQVLRGKFSHVQTIRPGDGSHA